MTITPQQCRAARALLDWSQIDLAEAASVGQSTVAKFERGARKQHASTLATVRAALEAAGIFFIANDTNMGPGVRLRDPRED